MDILLNQLGNPTLMFFILGIVAVAIKSDLEIPRGLAKFLSLYLLLAIGFKGGQEISHRGINSELLTALGLGLGSSIILPLFAFVLLQKRLGKATAAAIAASYGSVSAVTFVAAGSFLESKQILWDGGMVAVMAAMEAPAIIIGVLVYSLSQGQFQRKELSKVLHHAFANGSVVLLIGSFIIGCFADAKLAEGIKPLTSDLFKGFLALFLLEMGMATAHRLKGFWEKGTTALLFATLFPLLAGVMMALLSGYFLQGTGTRFMLSILTASASYIAVPAALQKAIPAADTGIYIPMPLGITFPMNLTLGMPLYLYVIEYWS